MGKLYLGKKFFTPAIVVQKEVPQERYGLTLDAFVGLKPDEDGVIKKSYGKANVVLDDIKTIGVSAMASSFCYLSTVASFLAPSLTEIQNSGMERTFYSSSYIASIDFPALTTIKDYGCREFCRYAYDLKSLNMSSVTTVGPNGLTSAFVGCSGLSGPIDLHSIRSVGDSGLYDTFDGCSKITSVNLSSLQDLGNRGMYNAFYNCPALTTVDLSSLQKAETDSLHAAFYQCVALEEVKLDSLTSISNGAMEFCFCATSTNPGVMKRIDFPSLTTVGQTAFGSAANYYAFRYRTTLEEIHFRADAQATIEAMTGYADKWGATNATIYFDL